MAASAAARSAVCALLMGLLAVGSAEVVDLTDESFESTVVASDHWLIAFTAPWCGHCKKLKEPWADTAAALEGKMRFGVVDATKHKKASKRFLVKGFPTIKYLHDGQVRDFKGPRTRVGIEEYATRVTSPHVSAAASVAAVRASLGTTGRAFVLAHSGSAGDAAHPLTKAFAEIAAELHDELRFVAINGDSGAAAVDELLALGKGSVSDGRDGPVVAVLDGKRWGEAMPPLSPAADPATADPAAPDPASTLRAWVSERSEPRVLAAGSHNLYDLKRCGRRVVLGVLDAAADDAGMQRAQLAAHADAFDGLRFAWVNARERPDYWDFQYGISAEALPTLLVLEARSSEKDAERHWVAHNGSAPLAAADEQAAFLRAVAAGELPSSKSGEGAGVMGTLLSVVRMLKAFAFENPLYFFGCCALNVLFLFVMCTATPNSPIDRGNTAARASANRQRKSSKAD